MATKEQVKVAALIAKAIYQTILDMGANGCPSGILYAHLSSMGMTLDQYQGVIESLKNLKAISESHHVLTANKDVGMALGLV